MSLPQKCMEYVQKCNWQWHVKFQDNRRGWSLCPSLVSLRNLPRKCMECVWKCNWPWHVKFQGNRRDWVSCPSETYPKNAWNVFKNVIDNGTSDFRTIGGVGVCVPHWCPSETYHENAWNAFENVISHGTSNFRAIGGIGFRVPRKPTPKMLGMCSEM